MTILVVLQASDLDSVNGLLVELHAQVEFDAIIDSGSNNSTALSDGGISRIDLILIAISTLPSTIIVESPEQNFLRRVLAVQSLARPLYLIELTPGMVSSEFSFVAPDHRLQYWNDPESVKQYLIRRISSDRLHFNLHAEAPESAGPESDESELADWITIEADNEQDDVVIPSPTPLIPPQRPVPFAPLPPSIVAPAPQSPFIPPNHSPTISVGAPPPAAGRARPVPSPESPVARRRDNPQASASKPPQKVQPTDDVLFTAYYPREIQAMRRYGLYVYAHLSDALTSVARDVEKFRSELGGLIPAPRTAKKSAKLKSETPITITPECDDSEITFDPPSLTKKWEDDWKRFDFDFKPPAELVGETVSGRISIAVYGVEVANIKFAFDVSAEPFRDTGPRQVVADILQRVRKENPLASAKYANSPTAAMYHRIFISYSRKDRTVAESYRLAQLAIGNDVFMDTYSIRTGEQWQAALAKAIDEADIFQLFWSENAAASTNVRDEWEYALHYKCPETDCATFVRPVYWVEPMPVKPPDELAHLNFRYVPMITASGSTEIPQSKSEIDS